MLGKIKGFILSHLNFDHIVKLVVAISLICIASGVNAGTVGSVGVSSDYVFRGQSQHGGDYALSASLGVETGSGLYANVWISDVDYGDGLATHEVDTVLGFSKELFGIGLDLAHIDYAYQGDSSKDLSEVLISADFGGFQLSHFVGQDDASDYTEVSTGVLEVVDLAYGDYDGVGSHYSVSKGFDALSGSVTLSYTDFTADDNSGISDETNLSVSYHYSF